MLVALLALTGIACGDRGADVADDVPPAATYSIRGLVRNIDVKSIGKTQLSIHHEAIPDFVGITGKVEGMQAMTMPFTVAESVDLEGVSPGTKIRFALTVDWSAPEPGLITALEILPPDTPLELGGSG